jgi:hypothetical protein
MGRGAEATHMDRTKGHGKALPWHRGDGRSRPPFPPSAVLPAFLLAILLHALLLPARAADLPPGAGAGGPPAATAPVEVDGIALWPPASRSIAAAPPPFDAPPPSTAVPAPVAATPVPFGVAEGERALRRYLATIDDREFDVHAEPAPMLRQVLLGHSHLKDSPYAGPRYLVHADGRVEPYSLDAYVASLREEKVGTSGGEDGKGAVGQREISEAILSVDSPGAVLLQGTSDIPAYCRRPMEADFAGTVRPPWFYEDGGVVRWILYTWDRRGGVVTRYRFAFRGGDPVPSASVLRIGERVGEHVPAE